MKQLSQSELLLIMLVLVALGWWRFEGWERLWWSMGVGLSIGVLILDQLLYVYWLKPHEQLSEYVRHLMNEKRYGYGVRTLWARREEQERLITQSVLFLISWPLVTLYVMTSTASGLGLGILMGLGVLIGVRMLRMRRDTKEFVRIWLWQIQRDVTAREVRLVYRGWLILVGVMFGLWLLIRV